MAQARNVSNTSTVAVRLLWPFIRICGADPRVLAAIAAEGLSVADFVQPDARLPHAILARIVAGIVEKTGDSEIGLKAGDAIQHGDMDVLDFAASTCTTLRGAIDCFIRYKAILHTGAELSLFEEGDVAMMRYRVTDGVRTPPAEHDFVVACVNAFSRFNSGREEPKLAVHFAHDDATNLQAYQRMFNCPIVFGAPYTAVVFPAERLSWPLRQSNPLVRGVFEAQLQEKIAALKQAQDTSSQVRNLMYQNLANGDIQMVSIARKLGMSSATLRRKLADEGTTHSALLDDVRRELALSYLEQQHLGVGEISFLLRFSDPAAFHRAFKRWMGTTPQAYRTQRR